MSLIETENCNNSHSLVVIVVPMKVTRVPRKKPRQSRSQATVDVILDAAARIFVETGFAAATTNAIAERAGVSVGSLYQYFPNKLALLAALKERHVLQLKTAMRATSGTLRPSIASRSWRLRATTRSPACTAS